MCGLFTLRAPPDQLGVDEEDEQAYLAGRFKVYPGDQVPVLVHVDGKRRLQRMRWGFRPGWAARSKAQINARSETVAEKAMFRKAFRTGRCLLPADGFFEPLKDSRPRRYFFFQRPGSEPFCFAAIHTRYSGSDEPPHETVALLTCEADAMMAPIHDRMPVILPEADWTTWLELPTPPDALHALLKPPPSGFLEHWEVPGDLYRRTPDDPECVSRRIAAGGNRQGDFPTL